MQVKEFEAASTHNTPVQAASTRPAPVLPLTCRYSLTLGLSPTFMSLRALYALMRTRLPASSMRSMACRGGQ
jgi:hypothetical protein